MVRKALALLLVFAFAACLLASCGEEPASPSLPSPSEGAESSVSSDGSSSVGYVIELPGEIPSEPESVPPPVESSEETSEVVSYPDPVFPGGELEVPVNPEDDAKVQLYSLTQTEKDALLTYGDLDPADPETAEALQTIQNLLDGYNKRVSFCAYALDGSRAIAYNCEEKYFSACTVKAGFLLYCCLAIEQGLASKDEVMYYQEKYYHVGSGKIKDSPYGTPYTLEYLIKECLRISDNVAYEMLSAYFGHTGYNEMIDTLGLERLRLGSSIWSYSMTARDLAIIWRELYFYFQTDTEMAKLYYDSCTNTPFNYATVYLKEKYSHKSGDNFGKNAVYNDGAIIWADRPYVIAILNASEGEPADEALVGNIVKCINDSLMK